MTAPGAPAEERTVVGDDVSAPFDAVDEAAADSFPASDPPSWWAGA